MRALIETAFNEPEMSQNLTQLSEVALALTWPMIPVAALILLMAILWGVTASLRIRLVVTGKVKPGVMKYVNHDAMPKRVALLSRSYDNQFQQPLLFILLMLVLIQFQIAGNSWYWGAGVFVVARYWHAVEHVQGSHLLRRTIAFSISSLTLWVMWLGVFLTLL